MRQMRLGFTYRYEEFREANNAVGLGGRTRRGPNWLLIGTGVVGILIIGLLLLVLLFGTRQPAPMVGPPVVPPAPTQFERLLPMFPWVLLFVIFFFPFLRSPKGEGPRIRGHLGFAKARSTTLAKLAVGFAMCFAVLATLALFGDETGRIAWENAVPWLVIGAGFFFLVRRMGENIARRGWEGQPYLQREQTIEIGDHKIVLSDPYVRHEYDWRSIQAFRETPNLILIHVSDYQVIFIPRRAFADEAQINLCKQILQSKIHGRIEGFPVLPAAPLPLPLPAPVAIAADHNS